MPLDIENDLIYRDEAIKILGLNKGFKSAKGKLNSLCEKFGLKMQKIGKHSEYVLSKAEVEKFKKEHPDLLLNPSPTRRKKSAKKAGYSKPTTEEPDLDEPSIHGMIKNLQTLVMDTNKAVVRATKATDDMIKYVSRSQGIPYPYSTDMRHAMEIIEAYSLKVGAKAARTYASMIAAFEAENSIRIKDLMKDIPAEDRIYGPLMVIDEFGSSHDFLQIVRKHLLYP